MDFGNTVNITYTLLIIIALVLSFTSQRALCQLQRKIIGQNFGVMGNLGCKASEFLFEINTGYPVLCLALCQDWGSGMGRCRSVFFRRSDGSCMGCKAFYTSATGLPSRPGTIYYGKSSSYNEEVEVDEECMFPNQLRRDEDEDGRVECRCQIGYPYDPQTNECVMTCGTYGTSFTFWRDTQFQDHKITTQFFMYSHQACMDNCVTMPGCVGFDRSTVWDRCHYKNTTAAFYPEDIGYLNGRRHHVRNCA